MRLAFLPLLLIALFAPTERPEGGGDDAAVTVIRAGTLLDGRSDPPRRNQAIVVRGQRIEAVGDAASTRAPAGATIIDLSGSTVPHPRVPPGRGPEGGRIRRAAPDGPAGVARRAGRGVGPPRPGAGLHHHPRRRDRRRRLRRRGDQGSDREGVHPRAADARGHARDLHDGRLSPRGLRARGRRPQGRPARGRPGRGAQGGPRAARPRRGLDQGVHDPPLLGRRQGQPRLAAHADGGGAEGDRGRGPRLAAQGRLPRLRR